MPLYSKTFPFSPLPIAMLTIYVGVDISDRLTPFFLLRFRFRFSLSSAHRRGGGGAS